MRRRPAPVRTAALAAWVLGCAGLAVGVSGPVAATSEAPQVSRIAAQHDRTPAQVRSLLADPAVQVGEGDRLYYADPPRSPGSARVRPQPQYRQSSTDLPDVLALQSRPGARRVIFLDFDGHDLRTTAWNSEGWPRGTYPAFSLDRDRTRLSDAERAAIIEIWERVAEDYAPFDVNVTTQDPGAAALVRNSRRDDTYGMRVLITDTSTSPALVHAVRRLCNGCAGLAWLDVFDAVNAERYQPALVFADQLEHDVWQIAETISHEVGHTLDLVHDADERTSYHLGTPPWSPIMGAGASGLSQWSKGEYAGARNHDGRGRRLPLQDDLAIITSKTGAVRDDHGDTASTATALGATATVEATGSITHPADRDVFALRRTCDAPLAVRVEPAPVGANLDVRLRVLDAAGRVVRDENPLATGTLWSPVVSGLDASATLPGSRGTWYVEVSGGSQRDRSASWSTYGSLGAYRLTASTCADSARPVGPVAPAPGDLAPPPPRVQPPLRPQRVRVARGPRGGRPSIVVRWTAARARGSDVTAYVLQARKHQGGRIVARKQGRVKPGKRRVEWRVGAGVWSVRVAARSRAGASATGWTARVRAR